MATKTTVRATLIPPNAKKEGEQPSTPMVGAGSLVVGGKEVITVRTYYGKGNGMQPVRACIWIRGAESWRTGRGSAGGCGYHKESAAIENALDNCGVQLWGKLYRYSDSKISYKNRVRFGGTGSSGYEDVFKAVARAMGYKGRMVWVSHGL